MSNSKLKSLEPLVQHRDALLLAEVAALLHDVGKFCNLHIETHSSGGNQKWSNDHAYKVVVDNPSDIIRLSKTAANVDKPKVLKNILKTSSPKAADFLPQEAKNILEKTVIDLRGQKYSLAELIMLGTPGFATAQNRAQLLDNKDGWLAAALGVCHSEAHHDKQDPKTAEEGQQPWSQVFISTALGFENSTVVADSSPQSLDARLKNLPWDRLVSSRTDLLEELAFGLGDTRRPINEVTLADWAGTVAALYKSALATWLLKSPPPDIRDWKNWEEKLIDHDLRWRLLRVNFDVLGLYAKAIKIADLLGYQQKVEEVCWSVKQLVEEDYPLGNEIYRDTSGIYFTFPDIDLPPDLAQEIRQRVESIAEELAPYIAVEQPCGDTATKQLTNMLKKGRQKSLADLAQPFSQKNLSPAWQSLWDSLPQHQEWELCPVCRLRPMVEGAEACETCLKRRQSRIDMWEKCPQDTIWMDEIADCNGRVALIVGKFGLDGWLSGELVQTMLFKSRENDPKGCKSKNPSPARLRRIWETCQRFWTETVEADILSALHPRQRWVIRVKEGLPSTMPDKAVCDGTLNGKPISVWRRNDRLLTISYVLEKPRHKDSLSLAWEGEKGCIQRSFEIEWAEMAGDEFASYLPSLSLLVSPDQFLALVPAVDGLEVVRRIEEQYRRQFGKVQNRLPLFLGLVFFPRKMPLMAVMSAARRMTEQIALKEEEWRVEYFYPSEDGKTCYLRFTRGHQWLSFNIPLKMGDNTTDDCWYPYFFVKTFAEGTPDQRPRRFLHNDRWFVHVCDLKPNDVVHITPSRFAYFFLESTAQRFHFDPERDALLLDDLGRLQTLWQDICHSPNMTNTRLQAISALFESKRQAWEIGIPTPEHPIGDETFRHLVETTLQRDKVNVCVEDVLNGYFQRTVDLHLHILKLRVEEEKKETQTTGGPK